MADPWMLSGAAGLSGGPADLDRVQFGSARQRILDLMSISSRLPAFLLPCLVLLVAGLLIAGFGVAVGVGIVAGSLLPAGRPGPHDLTEDRELADVVGVVVANQAHLAQYRVLRCVRDR